VAYRRQHNVKSPQNAQFFFSKIPCIAEEMANSEIEEFQLDVDVVEDYYEDDEGIGTIEVDADPSDVQLMLDSMAASSANFFEELGSTAVIGKENAWKHDDDNMCNVVLVDEVDKRNLEKTVQLTDATIKKAQLLLGIDRQPTINDCLELFLNREWYFMLENIINLKLPPVEKRCELPEVMQIMRMWILQMINKQTSTTLFLNDHHRWGLVGDLIISESRYNRLMKSFKTSDNEKPINADSDVDEESNQGNVPVVWGNLLEQEQLPRSLEVYVGNIGQNFVFDSLSDCTIDDNKLRHSSRGFRASGIAMSGFRGSRIGPVMNGLASVQTGILHSIHFNRFGDNPISITTALLSNINYGSASYQKKKLDILIAIDRGYNYGSVTDVLTEFGMRFLGTHSEKYDKWPFSTSEKVFPDQRVIPNIGARSVYTARKKVTRGEVTAHCYRNGSKLIGNVLTTEPVLGQWVLNKL
jgi:hypothetical protein